MLVSPGLHQRLLGYSQAPCLALQGPLPALRTPWLHTRPLPCTPLSPAQLPGDMSETLSPTKSLLHPTKASHALTLSSHPSPGLSHLRREPR